MITEEKEPPQKIPYVEKEKNLWKENIITSIVYNG